MSWEWVPFVPAVVAAVVGVANYNAPARERTEVLDCYKLLAELEPDDYRRSILQDRAHKRLTDYTWRVEYAPTYRRVVLWQWAVAGFASTYLLYWWTAELPQNAPSWVGPVIIGLGALMLLASLWRLLAAYRLSARKRAIFERNVRAGRWANNGDGPRARPMYTRPDEFEHHYRSERTDGDSVE